MISAERDKSQSERKILPQASCPPVLTAVRSEGRNRVQIKLSVAFVVSLFYSHRTVREEERDGERKLSIGIVVRISNFQQSGLACST